MDQLEMVMTGLAHCKNDNEMGALNCGYCPYDKYKGKNGEIDICTSKLCHDAYEVLKERNKKKK